MPRPAADSPLLTPNPHAVGAIVRASEHRTIVAARDIYDLQGVKLWARDRPVSRSLQQRLIERKLREPLEACLRAVDGVTGATLARAARDFIGSSHPIASCVNPYAAVLEHEVPRLPVEPAIQLLLTAAEEAGNGMFEHAVGCMLLCGALAASQHASAYDLRLALLAGLTHDLGEIYINPDYLDPRAALDAEGFRHVALHPRVGRLLIAELTDYPEALAMAVDEQHERLDGSGYPARRQRGQVSELGRMLAVVESVLGTIAGRVHYPMTRAFNGLRFVADEFDQRWTGLFVPRTEQAVAGPAERAPELVRAGLAASAARLAASEAAAGALATEAAAAREAKALAAYVSRRLALVRHAWADTGLWALAEEPPDAGVDADAELLAGEVEFRLRAVYRDAMMRADELSEPARSAVAPLLDALAG